MADSLPTFVFGGLSNCYTELNRICEVDVDMSKLECLSVEGPSPDCQ